jgi:hypothetical protein
MKTKMRVVAMIPALMLAFAGYSQDLRVTDALAIRVEKP